MWISSMRVWSEWPKIQESSLKFPFFKSLKYIKLVLTMRILVHGPLRPRYATIRNAQCNNSVDNLFWIRCILLLSAMFNNAFPSTNTISTHRKGTSRMGPFGETQGGLTWLVRLMYHEQDFVLIIVCYRFVPLVCLSKFTPFDPHNTTV